MTEQPVGGCSWIHRDDVIALAVQTGMKHSMVLIHIIQVERIPASTSAAAVKTAGDVHFKEGTQIEILGN